MKRSDTPLFRKWLRKTQWLEKLNSQTSQAYSAAAEGRKVEV